MFNPRSNVQKDSLLLRIRSAPLDTAAPQTRCRNALKPNLFFQPRDFFVFSSPKYILPNIVYGKHGIYAILFFDIIANSFCWHQLFPIKQAGVDFLLPGRNVVEHIVLVKNLEQENTRSFRAYAIQLH